MDKDRRWFERVAVTGAAAAVLDSGYLGLVYEIQDLSLGGARLSGKRRPPDESFEVLLHISNRFLERRARQVWFEDQGTLGTLGIEFEGHDVRDTLDWVDPHEEEAAACQTLASGPLSRNADLRAVLVGGAHGYSGARGALARPWSLQSMRATLDRIGLNNSSRALRNPLVGNCYALP